MLSSLSFVVLPLLTVASLAQSPSPYAPTFVQCPADLAVRPANGELSIQEQQWRQLRLGEVAKSIQSYLENAKIPDFDVGRYVKYINESNAPVAGMAISGGGSQSGMGGLGLWQAFDDRYEPAVKAGTGGLVQCLTYLSGLSGGGITTVVPLAANDFSSLSELRKTVDFTTNFITGPTGNPEAYYKQLFETAYAKLAKGFPVSVADIQGQWYRQYLPKSWGYKDFSDIASASTTFSKGLAPMPIVLYSEVVPGSSPEIGQIMYPDVNDGTVYEQTPFEFGSWDGGRAQSFFPTKYLGTQMADGKPVNSSSCVNGLDKMTLAQGTTGSAWNFWFIDAFYNIPLFYKRDVPIPGNQENNPDVQIVEETAKTFNQSFNQSLWATYPNPFTNINAEMNGVEELLLVDGSETGETIPLRPLIVPARMSDFIVAYDSGGDEPGNNWVNGTTFGQTAKAAKNLDIPFPAVPDAATFVNLELNKYPTFFGCNASVETPLVLYIPNAPWSAYTNYSYSTAEFTNSQLDLVYNNTLNIVTMGNGQGDFATNSPPFPVCIACGLVYKSLQRIGEPLPDACRSCFEQHCWNGTIVDTPSNPVYNPSLILDPKEGYQSWNNSVWIARQARDGSRPKGSSHDKSSSVSSTSFGLKSFEPSLAVLTMGMIATLLVK